MANGLFSKLLDLSGVEVEKTAVARRHRTHYAEANDDTKLLATQKCKPFFSVFVLQLKRFVEHKSTATFVSAQTRACFITDNLDFESSAR